MQTELLAADRLVTPMIGEGVFTREQASTEVQALLDRSPHLAEVAAKWRAGAKDNTVFLGPFAWTIIEYEGDDPRPAARVWLADYAATIRATGVDVQIAKLP